MLIPQLLKYVLPVILFIALLGGIYLKGHHDGAASVQSKMDAAVAAVKAQQVVELQKQSEDKDKIINDLNLRAFNRQKQIQTIIKTVRVSNNKECIFNKDVIELLNKVR